MIRSDVSTLIVVGSFPPVRHRVKYGLDPWTIGLLFLLFFLGPLMDLFKDLFLDQFLDHFIGEGRGGLSSSCEMIILRNNSHGKIIRSCKGIFTTSAALRNESQNFSIKTPHLTSTVHRLLYDRLLC